MLRPSVPSSGKTHLPPEPVLAAVSEHGQVIEEAQNRPAVAELGRHAQQAASKGRLCRVAPGQGPSNQLAAIAEGAYLLAEIGKRENTMHFFFKRVDCFPVNRLNHSFIYLDFSLISEPMTLRPRPTLLRTSGGARRCTRSSRQAQAPAQRGGRAPPTPPRSEPLPRPLSEWDWPLTTRSRPR